MNILFSFIMADNVYPTLSLDGWVEAPVPKLDGLLSDFGYSEFSQTTLYNGQVASLPHIIKVNQGDAVDTTFAINRILTQYLLRYFASARVESNVVDDGTSSMKVGITLYVVVTDGTGQETSMGRLLEFENSKLSNYIRLSNG